MSDEKERVIDELYEDDGGGPRWENMPHVAKLAVYEHLRMMIAQHRKDSAMATVLRDVASKGGPLQPASPIEVLHETLSVVFLSALETLEDADPDLCHDCGEYHADGYVHVPSTDPKDLS